MKEALPPDVAAAIAAADKRAYFEQRVFIRSPFGLWTTALLIFAVLMGLFALAWLASGRPALVATDGRVYAGTLLRLAIWFALMITVILAMQRYARVKDGEDLPSYVPVLRGGWESVRTELAPRDVSLNPATIVGIVLGAVMSYLLFAARDRDNLLDYPALLAWFAAVTTLLAVMAARGVALTRGGSRGMHGTIEDKLIIDLLRIDRLSVVGRSASRPALIWFTVSAVILLLFIGGSMTLLNVAFLLACAAMGTWVFVGTMTHVHQRIKHAKAEELERVRCEIDQVRAGTATSPADLQGLLAYEKRISDAQEWPFDQSTLVRFGASALILTIPWFGQAIAAVVVEHL
ncbi:MAG TPA: hypothetical protein VG387_06185 [Rhizomicrobium sp.]|jgi:hypothetical protein|nr:hypothetical protein [Rhizomicrobium sp.]